MLMWQHEVVESNKEKSKEPMMSHSHIKMAVRQLGAQNFYNSMKTWQRHPGNFNHRILSWDDVNYEEGAQVSYTWDRRGSV